MRFSLKSVGLEFADQAKHKVVLETTLNASPEAVFDVFASLDAWSRWFTPINSVRWTSAETDGVGAVRVVTLGASAGFMKIEEQILAWDRGERFAFRVQRSNRPLVSKMVEDYQLRPVDDGKRTHLAWIIAYEPSLIARAIHPIARWHFKRMFGDALKKLERYMESV